MSDELEQQARELLAIELEADGFHLEAELVRNPIDGGLHLPAIRAITKALSTRPSMDGVEEAEDEKAESVPGWQGVLQEIIMLKKRVAALEVSSPLDQMVNDDGK